METIGIWASPTIAVLVAAAIGGSWLRARRSRRKLAIRRMAESLASNASKGYDHLYERYLEHYMGGRAWNEEWDKAWTQHKPNEPPADTRGPAKRWW